VTQLAAGRSPLDDFRPGDLSTDMAVGALTLGTAKGVSKLWPAIYGADAAAAWPAGEKLGQVIWDLGTASPLGYSANVIASHLSGHPSSAQDFCNGIVGEIPDPFGSLAGTICGALP